MESQFRLSLSVKEYTNARKSSAKWQPDKRLIFVWPGVSIRFYSRVQKSDRKYVMTDNFSRGNDCIWRAFMKWRLFLMIARLDEAAIYYLKCWDQGTRTVVQIWNLLRNCGAVLLDIRDHLYIDYYNLILLLLILEGAQVIGEIWVWIPGTDHYNLYKRNQLNQN